jgi:hypothetical protein
LVSRCTLINADRELYDISNFGPSSPLDSGINRKVIGTFKDECGGKEPIEFVGLCLKRYFTLEDKDKPSKRTAKSVKKGFIKKRVRHDMYIAYQGMYSCQLCSFYISMPHHSKS